LRPYTFFEGIADAGLTPGYESAFFNTPDFQLHQKRDGWVHFHLIRGEVIVGAASFNIDGSLARSPLAAPFGGFEFADTVSSSAIFDFIRETTRSLEEQKVSSILLKMPTAYPTGVSALTNVSLINQGYRIINAEVGTILNVDTSAFEEKIENSQQLRLRQAMNGGLTTGTLPLEKFHEVYNLIERSHSTKKYSLSMTREALWKTVQAFPGRYVLHGVFDDRKLIAGSIGVIVRKNTFHNFYMDHDAAYDNLSPVVMLIKQIYAFCQDSGITVLDMGTSAADNAPNFGLLEFKMRLGAVPASKYTFEKTRG
jgi:hypothetical protein